jgi:hypothetical protein
VADFVVDVGVVDDDGVEVVVVLVAAVEDEEPLCELAVAAPVDPGSSFATRTPMSASDAAAATATDCVIRRTRTCARWRDRGELRSTASCITHSLLSDEVMKPSLPSPHPTARLASAVTVAETVFHRPSTASSHRTGSRRSDGGEQRR